MEKQFFELYEQDSSLVLEIGHNSVADWNVVIYDRKGKSIADSKTPAIHIQEPSRNAAFAKACIALEAYLSENRDYTIK